jgi:glycopeptide antibiotics resistance protein
MFSKERSFYLIMVLLIALEIFLFSNICVSVGERTGLNLATLYHLSIFFAFTFFLTLYIKKNNKIDYRTVAAILLISLAYAISDEFHQLFVIGRFASVKDVVVDMVGSFLALLIIKILEKFKGV